MKIIVVLICIYSVLGFNLSHGCTVVAVGKKSSEDGSVIISHTDSGADSRVRYVPAKKYKKGAKVPVYLGIQDVTRPLNNHGKILGYIPQVTRTYGYFHSAYSHINEHQLAIAESTMSQRDELVVTHETGKQIMTIEQVMIFALQRFKSSTEATAFIGRLMSQYGFLPSCANGSESLVIADTNDIWIFEVFSIGPGWTPESGKPGAIWAAQKLNPSHAMIIPNWSTIKNIDINNKENFMASTNYKQEAIDRGWYDSDSGYPFIWQNAYAPIPREWGTSRYWAFYKRFAPNAVELPDRTIKKDVYQGLDQYHQWVEPLSIYPFSVKPERKISVQDIMNFQRSYHKDTIYDMSADPAWLISDENGNTKKSPIATPFPGTALRKLLRLTYRRPVARRMGEYGMIAQLRGWLPSSIGGVYYLYLDNPHISPYFPIYAGNLSVHAGIHLFDPNHFDDKSIRWSIDFVDNLVSLKYQKAICDVKRIRAPYEAKMFGEMDAFEKEMLALYKKNPSEVRRKLTRFSKSKAEEIHDLYIQIRNELIVKYTNNKN